MFYILIVILIIIFLLPYTENYDDDFSYPQIYCTSSTNDFNNYLLHGFTEISYDDYYHQNKGEGSYAQVNVTCGQEATPHYLFKSLLTK